MKEGRMAPFCWQSLAATAAIRERFTGQDRTIALAIYSSLTWAANEHRQREDFELPRTDLSDLAGVSSRTLDRKVRDLEELGLVSRSGGRKSGRPNTWTLLEPGQEGGVSQSHPSASSVSPGASEEHHGVRLSDTTPYIEEKEQEEGKEPPLNPLHEHPATARILEILNGVAAGKSDTAPPTGAAIDKASKAFPDRDHVAVAEDLEYWATLGTASARRKMALAQTYRNFLKKADPAGRTGKAEHPADRRVRELREMSAQWAKEDGDGEVAA